MVVTILSSVVGMLLAVIFKLTKQADKREQMIKSLESTLEAYEERFKER